MIINQSNGIESDDILVINNGNIVYSIDWSGVKWM